MGSSQSASEESPSTGPGQNLTDGQHADHVPAGITLQGMLKLMRTFFFYIKITISQYKVKYKVDIRLNVIEQLAEPCSCRTIR